MERVRSQLGRVPLGGSETADSCIYRVDIDCGSSEDGVSVDHLGYSGGCSASGSTTLSVKGDRVDPPIGNEEGDPRQIPASSPTRGTREGTPRRRPAPRLITQVVLEELPLHP